MSFGQKSSFFDAAPPPALATRTTPGGLIIPHLSRVKFSKPLPENLSPTIQNSPLFLILKVILI